jgi:hypothetical protein
VIRRTGARLRRWWSSARWPLLALLTIVALVLGHLGFREHLLAIGEPAPFSRVLYLALQLFTLESGSAPPPTPWTLEIARLLAPAVTLYSAAVALGVVFREEVGRARLRTYRGHAVICGLGDRGLLLARSFRKAGMRVAAVELDRDAPGVGAARAAGAVVVVGDASDPDVLRRARVSLASVVVSVCGDDGVNAAVASVVQRLAPDRADPIRVFAHIADSGLRALLQVGELTRHECHALVELFDVAERGAGVMMSQLPPHSVDGDRAPHVVVVGLDELGDAVVLKISRWWRDRRRGPGRIRITVIDPIAGTSVARLLRDHRSLDSVAVLVPVEIPVESPEFCDSGLLTDSTSPIDAIYVCEATEARSLAVAALLRERITGTAPMLVRVGGGPAPRPMGGVRFFFLLQETCAPQVLLGGVYERIARAIHADYVRREERLGRVPAENPSMVPWDRLPDLLKASNRAQAADIGAKLGAIGCVIESGSDWDAPLLALDTEEVEVLSRIEHDRWAQRLLDDGWSFALGAKDPVAKTHPDLVPYHSLSDEKREADRSAVRGIPAFLEAVGFHATRLG